MNITVTLFSGWAGIAVGMLALYPLVAAAFWAWDRATCRWGVTATRRGPRVTRNEIWAGSKALITGTGLCGTVAAIYAGYDREAEILVHDIWDPSDDAGDCPLAVVVPLSECERLTRESPLQWVRRIRSDWKAA